MEKQNQLLKGIESLSEQEKLELFKIEELETRLEMISSTTLWDTTNNGSCRPK